MRFSVFFIFLTF